MGGGDLNSKKSWHPNTIKNQERVWKAEQAAAEEKKRISELQRERAEERDRAELNDIVKRTAGSSSDNRLNWMYDKPEKKVKEEDYLLGKSIDQNYGRSEKDEQNPIPAVARRVVCPGVAAGAGGGDAQVDLVRKIREDPLLLVKERERAARAALLNNPLHRRRLADLLRKEQAQRKEKTKKKSKKKGKDLDNMLAAKLTALSADKGVDIAKLLGSDSSSSDSDESADNKAKKKKKKKEKVKEKKKKKSKSSKSKKKSNYSSVSIDSSDNAKHKKSKHHNSSDKDKHISKSVSRKRKSIDQSEFDIQSYRNDSEKETRRERDTDRKRSRRHSSDESVERRTSRDRNKGARPHSSSDRDREGDRRRIPPPDFRNRPEPEARKKWLSEDERAAKLAAMASAGAEREQQRGRRVAEQRRADAASDAGASGRPRASTREARALPDSLESRIRSNRHYIQRDKQHMNEHFAKR